MKQHHIAIIASQRDRTVRFYETLGFSVTSEYERTERQDRIVFMSDGDVVLEIFIKSDAPKRPSYPEAFGLRHIAFTTDDFDMMIEHLKNNGYMPEPIRCDSITGERMAFVFDPDGLPIELHE